MRPFLSISIYCFSPEIRLPPPSECDLYYVNRDTLFSYHRDSELFLQVKSDWSVYVGWLVIDVFICSNALLKYSIIAANDGLICCISLQEFSKWFAIDGGCSSTPLICTAWYNCFSFLLFFFLNWHHSN